MKEQNIEDFPDRITKLFVGKNIFVTGGTGFIGKVFIEKVLRECPNIGGFYVLIRTKKGKTPQERLNEYFKNPIFAKLKEKHGSDILERKCHPIVGDMLEKDLGISDEDRKFLTENIHYIYHVAATVRFDEPLKTAVMLNTRGTKFVLELGAQCKKLEFFCHCSTSYSHPEEKLIEEKFYSPPGDPHEIITCLEHLTPEMVAKIEAKLLKDSPNTYTFSKALGEELVRQYMDKLPIVVVRPSVVIPVWKEPLPGWGENINGPVGLLIGAGKGIVRTMYCNSSYYADFMPVDCIANLMALVTWDYLTTNKERRLYNFTSSDEIQVTWQEIIDIGQRLVITKLPFNNVVWYPGGAMKSSKFLHYVTLLFTQIIPAFIVDTILFCLGYKPVLWRIQKRIINGYNLMEHYTNNQWLFNKKNSETLRSKLNPKELQIYYCTKENLDIDAYFLSMIHGARLFVMKESDDSIPAAKRHMKIMWVVDKIFKLLLVTGILYFFYNHFFSKYL